MSLAVVKGHSKLAKSSLLRLRDSTWYSLKAQLSPLYLFIFVLSHLIQIIKLKPNRFLLIEWKKVQNLIKISNITVIFFFRNMRESKGDLPITL